MSSDFFIIVLPPEYFGSAAKPLKVVPQLPESSEISTDDFWIIEAEPESNRLEQ